jgi:hypothetical protein
MRSQEYAIIVRSPKAPPVVRWLAIVLVALHLAVVLRVIPLGGPENRPAVDRAKPATGTGWEPTPWHAKRGAQE